MTFLLAGFETSATTLTWALDLLSRHPIVWSHLADEVFDVLGYRTPSPGDLPRLRYARAVVEETLRLRPALWAIPRMAATDDVVGGYRVPKGDLVVVVPYVTHRHPEFWTDPEIFDPARFLPEHRRRIAHWAFPFGGWPAPVPWARLCPHGSRPSAGHDRPAIQPARRGPAPPAARPLRNAPTLRQRANPASAPLDVSLHSARFIPVLARPTNSLLISARFSQYVRGGRGAHRDGATSGLSRRGFIDLGLIPSPRRRPAVAFGKATIFAAATDGIIALRATSASLHTTLTQPSPTSWPGAWKHVTSNVTRNDVG